MHACSGEGSALLCIHLSLHLNIYSFYDQSQLYYSRWENLNGLVNMSTLVFVLLLHVWTDSGGLPLLQMNHDLELSVNALSIRCLIIMWCLILM